MFQSGVEFEISDLLSLLISMAYVGNKHEYTSIVFLVLIVS